MQQFLLTDSQNLTYLYSNIATPNQFQQSMTRFKIMIPYKENLNFQVTTALLLDLQHHIHSLATPQFQIKAQFFLQITQKCIFVIVFTSSKVKNQFCGLYIYNMLDLINRFKTNILLQNEDAKNSQNFPIDQIQANPIANLSIRDFYQLNCKIKYKIIIEDYLEDHSLDLISEKIIGQEINEDYDQYLQKLFMLDDSTDYFSIDSNFEGIKQEYSEQVNKYEKALQQNQNKDSKTLLKICFQENFGQNKAGRKKKKPQTVDQQKTKPKNNKIQQNQSNTTAKTTNNNIKQPKISKQQQQHKNNSNQNINKNKKTDLNKQLFDNDIIELKSQIENLLVKFQTQRLQLKQQQQQNQQQQQQDANPQLFQIQGQNENQDAQQLTDILLYSWIYSQLKSLYTTHYNNQTQNNSQKSESDIYNEISQLFQLTYQNSDSQEKDALERYLIQWKEIFVNDFQTFIQSNMPQQQQQLSEN